MIRLFTRRRRSAPPRPGPGPVATTDRMAAPRTYLNTALNSAAAQASRNLLSEAGRRSPGIPSPSRITVTAQSDDSEPDFIEATSVLTAVVRPGIAPLEPGRYEVTYGRLGRHGRAGTPVPVPLTTIAGSAAELAEAIAHDARQYLADARPDVITDLAVMGGHIRTGGRTVGSFTLRPLQPEQEEATAQ